jgi:hypothetical protein
MADKQDKVTAKSLGETKSLSAVPSKRGEFFVDGYPVRNYGYSDRTRPNGYKVLRLHLIEKYGVCYFCSRPVKDYPHVPHVGANDDLGTIDHLKPRPHQAIPGRKRYEVVEKVLACYRCNHDRNVKHQRTKNQRNDLLATPPAIDTLRPSKAQSVSTDPIKEEHE